MDEIEIQGAGLAFNLASQLVFSEPEVERFSMFVEQDVFSGVPFGEEDEAVVRGVDLMHSWCVSQQDVAPEAFAAVIDGLKAEQSMLFTGANAAKAPSWTGYYLDPKSSILSQYTVKIRKMYNDFGLRPDGIAGEPDDNLGIMLGFIAKLIAIEINAPDRAEASRETQKKLLEELVAPWISVWRRLVSENAESDFYRGVGELVFGLCRAYANRFDVECVEDGQ